MFTETETDPVIDIAEKEIARMTAEKEESKSDTEKEADAKKTNGSEESDEQADKKTNQGDDDEGEKTDEEQEDGKGSEELGELEDELGSLKDEDINTPEGKEKINAMFAKATKLRLKDRAEADTLKGELAELKEKVEKQDKSIEDKFNPPEETAEANVKKILISRRAEYLEADKGKDLADRREMSKDDLEQWLIDDPVDAQDWMLDRKLRYQKETKELFDKEMSSLTSDDDEEAKQQRQVENKRVASENKDLDFIARSVELAKDGKEAKEVLEILRSEFPIFKELQDENEQRYVKGGLSLLVKDYKERQGKKSSKELSSEDKEALRQEGATREKNRQKNIDEGTGSDVNGKPNKNFTLTDDQKKAAKMAGMSDEDYIKALKRQQKESNGG